jgi:hypothetical protein
MEYGGDDEVNEPDAGFDQGMEDVEHYAPGDDVEMEQDADTEAMVLYIYTDTYMHP